MFARDRHRCQYCGSDRHLTLDHVVPRSRGGEDTWDNLVTSCAPCNRKKGDRPAHAAGLNLARTPRAPEPAAFVFMHVEHIHESWRPYLSFALPDEPQASQHTGAILRAVIIDASREPRLQFDDAEPFGIDSGEVKRDIERSTLTNIVRDGAPTACRSGPASRSGRAPTWSSSARRSTSSNVLDLLSTESDDELADDETI